MKFIAVGSYTAEGLAGFMKNPKDDRKAVVGGPALEMGDNLYYDPNTAEGMDMSGE